MLFLWQESHRHTLLALFGKYVLSKPPVFSGTLAMSSTCKLITILIASEFSTLPLIVDLPIPKSLAICSCFQMAMATHFWFNTDPCFLPWAPAPCCNCSAILVPPVCPFPPPRGPVAHPHDCVRPAWRGPRPVFLETPLTLSGASSSGCRADGLRPERINCPHPSTAAAGQVSTAPSHSLSGHPAQIIVHPWYKASAGM